ncbi:hypothetical protein [Endozoicomonas montiporae]|uniref:Uncharacterized protein n=1 Tax=Endozoicomonas montiporae CL-33 TaxID=570277 RepID=A0A142BHY3_9GAMM|nr:hypothetical protein [Endozoicomonas montiporae]AMO58359.1 hypothetical protein EZMO1_4443 [Endozoicomonas montiporae CL-33]
MLKIKLDATNPYKHDNGQQQMEEEYARLKEDWAFFDAIYQDFIARLKSA